MFQNFAAPRSAIVLVLAALSSPPTLPQNASESSPQNPTQTSIAAPITEYVGSQSCVACHAEAAELWTTSHHAHAWMQTSPDAVVADFDGTSFAHNGMTATFRTEDGEYHITVTEMDGVRTDYPVHSVVGIEPLQQYLLETEPGRLQSFDVVWDTERHHWFHLYPDQDLPPDDGLHWSGPYKTWNARCAECHATGYEKTYDAATRSYASRQAEIGVGCEACHGPGRAHADWAATLGTEQEAPAPEAYGFDQPFATTEATIQQCATCHSRREAFEDASPRPGTPYHDAYNLSLLRPGLYHADGQIRDEVYVYGSFLQSKMYAKGVGCLNCHDAHSGALLAEGNAVCAQCHSLAGNPEFETLRLADYDSPEHHFHTPGSEGAQCTSCHAPEPRSIWATTGAPITRFGCHAPIWPPAPARPMPAPVATATATQHGPPQKSPRASPTRPAAARITVKSSPAGGTTLRPPAAISPCWPPTPRSPPSCAPPHSGLPDNPAIRRWPIV